MALHEPADPEEDHDQPDQLNGNESDQWIEESAKEFHTIFNTPGRLRQADSPNLIRVRCFGSADFT